jgi:hypothetical protein
MSVAQDVQETRAGFLIHLGIALLSAATLAFELTLTRLFALAQWYHFAFLAVSVALLGFGASGSALALWPQRRGGFPWPAGASQDGQTRPYSTTLAWIAAAFTTGLILGYLAMNYLPFDSYLIAWERRQILYLLLYYLSPALPFFWSGLALGLVLAARPEQAASLYGANLIGSAGGVACALGALALLGGPGTVLACAVVGWLSVGLFAITRNSLQAEKDFIASNHQDTKTLSKRFKTLGSPRLCGYVLILAGLVALTLAPPPLFDLRLSPYKGLSQVLRFPDARVVFWRWDAMARVDVVRSGAIRSAPGLSLAYMGAMPPQLGLFTDGENLSPITAVGGGKEWAGFADNLPVALPYRLRPGGRALILEPRGGLDLLVALQEGASEVTAVESLPAAVAAARAVTGSGQNVYDDPRVTVIVEHGRSYVRRSRERFDVVQVSLTDSYRPVTSGAYSLSENYFYTVEAVQDYLARLDEGGLLVMERWLQLPPSEELRAGALAVTALERSGVARPGQRLIVIRSLQTALFLVKNGDFSQDEVAQVKSFCQARSFDLVYYPGITSSEANLYNILPEPYYYRAFQDLLFAPDRQVFYAAYPFDVTPPGDDRPFFFHFFRWRQTPVILATLGRTWQPFGGSGYLILVALLVLATVASAVLILLPLAVRQRGTEVREGKGVRRATVFLYFALLGLAFLFVEIPLLQRFILFLGQPAIAFAAVLVALLLSSGCGSLWGTRLPRRVATGVLAVAVLLYPAILPPVFAFSLGWPLAFRLGVTGLLLAPLGFLMGNPFPAGIAWLERTEQGLIPWAWGVNGCASVLAAILAAMGALTFGFSGVLIAGALAYAAALAISLSWRQ